MFPADSDFPLPSELNYYVLNLLNTKELISFHSPCKLALESVATILISRALKDDKAAITYLLNPLKMAFNDPLFLNHIDANQLHILLKKKLTEPFSEDTVIALVFQLHLALQKRIECTESEFQESLSQLQQLWLIPQTKKLAEWGFFSLLNEESSQFKFLFGKDKKKYLDKLISEVEIKPDDTRILAMLFFIPQFSEEQKKQALKKLVALINRDYEIESLDYKLITLSRFLIPSVFYLLNNIASADAAQAKGEIIKGIHTHSISMPYLYPIYQSCIETCSEEKQRELDKELERYHPQRKYNYKSVLSLKRKIDIPDSDTFADWKKLLSNSILYSNPLLYIDSYNDIINKLLHEIIKYTKNVLAAPHNINYIKIFELEHHYLIAYPFLSKNRKEDVRALLKDLYASPNKDNLFNHKQALKRHSHSESFLAIEKILNFLDSMPTVLQAEITPEKNLFKDSYSLLNWNASLRNLKQSVSDKKPFAHLLYCLEPFQQLEIPDLFEENRIPFQETLKSILCGPASSISTNLLANIELLPAIFQVDSVPELFIKLLMDCLLEELNTDNLKNNFLWHNRSFNQLVGLFERKDEQGLQAFLRSNHACYRFTENALSKFEYLIKKLAEIPFARLFSEYGASENIIMP